MDLITSKSELIERLKDVLAVEIKARAGYLEDLSTFKNSQIIETIERIKKDEDRHIMMLSEIIELINQ